MVKPCREPLFPLTQNRSREMLNFFDKPLIEFQIQLMKQRKISEISVVLEEEDRDLRDYLAKDETVTVFVLSAHGLSLKELALSHKHCILIQQLTVTDFSLEKLLSHHISHGEAVTAVFPTTEKQVQNGIFVFSENNYHFQLVKGKDILQAISEQNIGVNILYETGYFNPVSNLSQYLDALKMCLDKQELLADYHHSNGVVCKENTFIEVGAKIKPPVYLGDHVTVRKNAEILPYSVICSRTVIGENAKISHSVLLPDCKIQNSASVSGSVLDYGVTVTENASVTEGSVYGKNTVASSLETPSEKLPKNDGEHISFQTNGIPLPEENATVFLQKIGKICGELLGKGILGLFLDDNVKTQFLSHSLRLGLQASGASLYEFPPCTLSMCRSACPFYHLKAGFYLHETEKGTFLTILDNNGHMISPRWEEKIITAMGQQSVEPDRNTLLKIIFAKPYQLYYYSEITRRLGINPADCKLWANVTSPVVWEYLQKIANCYKITLLREQTPHTVGFSCNASATEFTIYDENQTPLTPRQIEAVTAALAISEQESNFVITKKTPQALSRYLKEHRVTPLEAETHPHSRDVLMSKIPLQAYLARDPIYLMIKLLLHLRQQRLSLSQWVMTLPKSFLIEKTVTAGEHLAEAVESLLRIAQDNEDKGNNHYRFSSKKGVTTVSIEGENLNIVSESNREEYAEELTDFYVRQCFPDA